MSRNIDSLTKLIIEGIQEKKGKKIAVIDLESLQWSGTLEFIICQGNSSNQVTAIADSVREYVLKHGGIKPYNYDGYRNAQWIVIDYGEVLVHIFQPSERERYNLEELWSDVPITEIADLD